MSNPALLRTLCSLLASFYPEETSARRLVVDAGLDASRITFSGQAINTTYVEYTAAGGRFPWPLPSLDGEEPPAPGESPYKSLRYFDTTDAALFFGRERLTAELVAYLRTHRFLAVVGTSGSGKSSPK